MLDIPKIQAILRRASCFDLYGSSFGGSYVHGHLFRPVADRDELGLWEEEMGLAIPEDYRCYLTCLGNGGAGPSYGICPFHFRLDGACREAAIYSWGQEQRFHDLAKRRYELEEQDIFELYQEYCSRTPEEGRLDYNGFEEMLWDTEVNALYKALYKDGILRIANHGCSADIGLLLNGSHRGCVGGISQEGSFFQLAPAFSLAECLNCWKPFADYLMEYVRRTQDFCDSLSADKKRQALRERELVLPFQAAVEHQDWTEVLCLLKMAKPEELSEKTTFFFKYHRLAIQKGLPGEVLVAEFYQGIEKYQRWNYNRYHGFYDLEKQRVIKDSYDAHYSYAIPTFQQFFQTYVDMNEEIY